MEAWVYIKVIGKEVVVLGPLYKVRDIVDEMLVDSEYYTIQKAGEIALQNYAECCTLKGHQFNDHRGYIRDINV